VPAIYCDVNVYNDVERGAIPNSVIEAFRQARARREISVHVGLPDIEEALGVWRQDPSTAARRLRTVDDLAGFDGLLQQPGVLFTEAFRAYATAAPTPSLLLPRRDRRHWARVFRKIAAGHSKSYGAIIDKVVSGAKSQKETFKKNMTAVRADALTDLAAKQLEGRPLSFENYFDLGAETWASTFADRLGSDVGQKCRERGLAGLLTVPAVRLAVGTAMSIHHKQIWAGRVADFGDGFDIWHALLASTADIFVTGDQRLYEHVARIPNVPGFQAARSLDEALEIARTVLHH
jgi:hypothetical protein